MVHGKLASNSMRHQVAGFVSPFGRIRKSVARPNDWLGLAFVTLVRSAMTRQAFAVANSQATRKGSLGYKSLRAYLSFW